MSDEFDTSPAPGPVDVPTAPEAPSSAPPDTSEIINERRHVALSQLAKSEDISGYAAEREDQSAVIDRGEDIPQQRQNQWFRRASKALQDATLQAQGIDVNAPQGEEQQEAPSGFVPADEVEHMLDQERKTAQARMRVDQYFGANTQRKDEIVNWHSAMDPGSVCAQWVIDSGTPVAGQLMERLADHPEALQQIAEMPPSQRDRTLGHLEGRILAETQMAQQMAQQQRSWDQDRRTTKAPPIIRPPRGGANPPTDIYSLAGRAEDISSYVQARKAMEKRNRD
jgi:hypothetical protein